MITTDETPSAERLRRFEDEARAVAALSHPNVLAVHDVGTQVDPEMVLAAAVTSRRDRVPFRDALILAAASAAGCGQVLSEDLQHGRSSGRVRVVDPFCD